MVRSFSYAAGAALGRTVESPEDEAKLGPLAADWETETRATFLSAYDEVARSAGLYAYEGDMRALLELFEIEKALYELRYELNNRPDWVRWPLAGILRLLPTTDGSP
jgi:maltose alpha-D-glucosyltransferase/alpha-amylase